MKTVPVASAHRAAGFTLVELMVSLVIGLLLTLVIGQLFIGSRRTFATTDDVSRMQESMRFASALLARTIHQAGYRTSPNTKADFIFGPPNIMIDGTAGAGAVPDSLTVRFQGNGVGVADGSVVNCRGERIAPGVMSENRFSIENVAKNDAGGIVQVPSLVCRVDTDGFNTQYVIVPDVDNMKILYGEDTNADANADLFVPRGAVTNINTVVALRIAMLFRSPNANVAASLTPTGFIYTLNGQALPAFNDSRARRDAVFTVGIRNRSL